eukprot:TRINITY_DN341_c0_g1_i2.p1 TRINITY_DN341_c0_g1~~TRINITY_DN341_c0_g1_i2.p1  ORF type:complete len:390 (+),score=75.64 TRINITY_DN341_c0_g1_i2:129-1298(+)
MQRKFLSRLKDVDAYPKILEDFKVKTLSGAFLTIASITIISILVFSEFVYYWRTERVDHIEVDHQRTGKINIQFDISFPHVSCEILTIGALDISGEHQLNVQHDVHKRPITQDLRVRGSGAKEEVNVDKEYERLTKALGPRPVDYCGDCFGAGTTGADGKPLCCNTCDELRQAYHKKGWAFTPTSDMEQCIREALERKLQPQLNEGCNLRGKLSVNKVGGNFHFTIGRAYQNPSFGRILPEDLQEFNMTHVIHDLTFGVRYPGLVNPLDGVQRSIEEGVGQFQYFIKVVPTNYGDSLRMTEINTNQFSVTEHVRRAPKAVPEFSPGVFFIYDFSPIRVRITRQSRSFAQFLTSVCAIVGGVYTVAGLLDSFLYHSINTIANKIQMGKMS